MDELTLTAEPAKLSKTSALIISSAQKRGIKTRIVSIEKDTFTLSFHGEKILCCDALTEKTDPSVSKTVENKNLTTQILAKAGFSVPAQQIASTKQRNNAFLEENERIVIKPLSLSSGAGVSIDIQDTAEMKFLINELRESGQKKQLLEQYVQGKDLRILVIDNEYVAAIHRAPPQVIGTGLHTIAELVKIINKNRKITNAILVDSEAERCINSQGYSFDDIPEEGAVIIIRKNTNESTGAVPCDVTRLIHPSVRKAAVEIAAHLEIPVAGIDLMVPSIRSKDYMFIEANSSPGLYGHEPQPVVERFLDYVFEDSGV